MFADYWTDGLDIVEFVKGRTSWIAVLGLRRVYTAGETFELRTERRIVGGFAESKENWGSVMYAPAKSLTIEITGSAASRIRNPALSAPALENTSIDRGPRSIKVHVERPRINSSYGLQWAW